MEKFGIFELLDTLSALLLPETKPPAPPKETPRTDDSAFAPPPYAGAPAADPSEGTATAISSFLKKHDDAAKKIGKK